MNTKNTRKKRSIKRTVFISVAVLVMVVIPSVLPTNDILTQLLSLLVHTGVFVFLLGVLEFLKRRRYTKPVGWIIALSAAFFTMLEYTVIAYWFAIGALPNLHFLTDAISEAPETLMRTYGGIAIIAALLGLLVLWMGSALLLLLLSEDFGRTVRVRKGWTVFVAGLSAILVLTATPSRTIATEEIISEYMQEESVRQSARVSGVPDNSALDATGAKENVFIIQMESVNSLGITGLLTNDKVDFEFMPTIRKIAQEHGVLLPFMWGNSVQTHRGLESILCGITYNVGKAYADHTEDINTPCLPEVLRDQGYDTVWLSSFMNPAFENKNKLMKKAGMDDQKFASFMKKGDKRYQWGYDDCAFYNRALEYLDEEHSSGKPLFATLGVSMHHAQFNAKPDYKFLAKFKNPTDFTERYLNSFLAQDYCVGKFFEKYEEKYGENSHLIIVADHTWPLGITGVKNAMNEHGASTDNFLIPFAYVPPRSHKDDYRVGDIEMHRFGQSDIPATVVDLLTGRPAQNSFAFALRKGDMSVADHLAKKDVPYEECHVMSQPYNDTAVMVARGDDASVYSFKKFTLSHYDLAKDLLQKKPTKVEESVPLSRVESSVLCDRMVKKRH